MNAGAAPFGWHGSQPSAELRSFPWGAHDSRFTSFTVQDLVGRVFFTGQPSNTLLGEACNETVDDRNAALTDPGPRAKHLERCRMAQPLLLPLFDTAASAVGAAPAAVFEVSRARDAPALSYPFLASLVACFRVRLCSVLEPEPSGCFRSSCPPGLAAACILGQCQCRTYGSVACHCNAYWRCQLKSKPLIRITLAGPPEMTAVQVLIQCMLHHRR